MFSAVASDSPNVDKPIKIGNQIDLKSNLSVITPALLADAAGTKYTFKKSAGILYPLKISFLVPKGYYLNTIVTAYRHGNAYEALLTNGEFPSAASRARPVDHERIIRPDGADAESDSIDQFHFADLPLVEIVSVKQVTQKSGTVFELEVELVEQSSSDVEIDLELLESRNTIASGDIEHIFKEDARFQSTDSLGTTRTITVKLKEGVEHEDNRRVLFGLSVKNNETLIEQQTAEFSLRNQNEPMVVINEILADPPEGADGDANADEDRNDREDQFVEILNEDEQPVDLSAWSLTNGSETRHIFPEGTVLESQTAAVVFGGGEPSGDFAGSIVQTASEGEGEGLDLRAESDSISLVDTTGNVIDSYSYGPEGNEGQSLTRIPEQADDFLLHTEASLSGEQLFSPGVNVDGTPFDTTLSVALNGREGWRMIAAPVRAVSYDEFLGNFWIQGVPGSSSPEAEETLFKWSEAEDNRFSVPSSMDEDLEPGKGYIMYFFDDDNLNEPGVQGGFPKILRFDADENDDEVRIPVSSTDSDDSGTFNGMEGWNLLGNPFDVTISVDEVIDVLNNADSEKPVSNHLYVWNPSAGEDGSGAYERLTYGEGATISPLQAFWVRFSDIGLDEVVTFSRDRLRADRDSELNRDRAVGELPALTMRLHNGDHSDEYRVEFHEDADIGRDLFDGFKLPSLNPDKPAVFSETGESAFSVSSLPSEPEAVMELPLVMAGSNGQDFELSWSLSESIPESWDLQLYDAERDRELDLQRSDRYRFTIQPQRNRSATDEQERQFQHSHSAVDSSRFSLIINPGIETSQTEPPPETTKLNPNYPNPFSSYTTIPFDLDEEADVTLRIYNIVGQEIATIVDETLPAGEYTDDYVWNPGDLPSGVYIAQLEVGSQVFIRKMTLVK